MTTPPNVAWANVSVAPLLQASVPASAWLLLSR
jgi:hypothetical protein